MSPNIYPGEELRGKNINISKSINRKAMGVIRENITSYLQNTKETLWRFK